MGAFRFYLDTGKVGGTGNPSDKTMYVDVYNGDDANTGAWNAPKQSIQGVLDGMLSVSMTEADVILASGVYEESGFLNFRSYGTFIADGFVLLEGNGGGFRPFSRIGLNHDVNSSKLRRNYGKIQMRNYINAYFGHIEDESNRPYSLYNSHFINVSTIASAQRIKDIQNCVIEDCTNFCSLYRNFTPVDFVCSRNNNTIINSTAALYDRSGFGGTVLHFNNIYDANSRAINDAGTSVSIMNNNLYLGTLANKISYLGVNYSNVEELKLAVPSVEIDSLASTTDPEFEPLTYIPSLTSPLVGAGFDGKQIGAYEKGVSTPYTDAGWTFTGIDDTTEPDKAILDVSPTGVAEIFGVEISPKKVTVKRINIIDPEIFADLGEVISSRLAADGTPNRYALEIQYSNDNITYNGTWLQVPIQGQPLHDTVNDVGNADPAFDITTASVIRARYLAYRVTLRDNEQII